MAILLEAATIVVENDTLVDKYAGGIYGFVQDWRNGSFCTDGILSRISFFNEGDAFCALLKLKDRGLAVSGKYAADVAVFVDGGRPWSPCLWLETDFTYDGMPYCWHAESPSGRLAVPRYYREGASLACFSGIDKSVMEKRVVLVAQSKHQGFYQDNESRKIIGGPLPLCRH